MKCFWCGEEIEDDSIKCKYCGIKIDKEAIEKRRIAKEKDERETNTFGLIGLMGALIPTAFFTELPYMFSYEQKTEILNIILTIIVIGSFICSIIATVTAIKGRYSTTSTTMYAVGMIINLLWILLFLNVFLKGTALLSTIGLIIFFINQKSSER